MSFPSKYTCKNGQLAIASKEESMKIEAKFMYRQEGDSFYLRKGSVQGYNVEITMSVRTAVGAVPDEQEVEHFLSILVSL